MRTSYFILNAEEGWIYVNIQRNMEKRRENWIDYLKSFACVLVVLGHFFQSMVASNLIQESSIYSWFNTTIYYFHVPIFFICSGYLYQKTCKLNNAFDFSKNIMKKAIVLGVPYVTFSIVTWVLKILFSNSVNIQVGGLLDALLIHPISPYWYLFCLFFIFAITPTCKKTSVFLLILLFSTIGKIISCTGFRVGIYAIDTILANEIWFVAGMALALWNKKINDFKIANAVVMNIIFITLSVMVYRQDVQNEFISFGLGVVACFGCVTFFSLKMNKEKKFLSFFSKYTTPIFLMHTIFAASMRAVLMKIGIYNNVIHIFIGVGISFVGPIIATEIVKKYAWMDFFIYPARYIKF